MRIAIFGLGYVGTVTAAVSPVTVRVMRPTYLTERSGTP